MKNSPIVLSPNLLPHRHPAKTEIIDAPYERLPEITSDSEEVQQERTRCTRCGGKGTRLFGLLVCTACDGSGTLAPTWYPAGRELCRACGGHGKVKHDIFPELFGPSPVPLWRRCTRCLGTRLEVPTTARERCTECDGYGYERRSGPRSPCRGCCGNGWVPGRIFTSR
jgi:hypothetical protein